MINFTYIVEDGFRYGENYNGLQYQLAVRADNAAIALNSFVGTVPGIESNLSAHINALVPGLNIPTETRERAALFSLEYANGFTSGQGATLTAMLGAIQSGDRAEAWFDLRYGLNSTAQADIAREHFDEAQVFGLFQSSSPTTQSDVSDQESLLAFRMATRHETTIKIYETQYAAQLGAALADVNAISSHTGIDYGPVSTLATALSVSMDRLTHNFSNVAELAHDLSTDLPGDTALAHPGITAVWVAPDVAGDQGAAHLVDRSVAPAANDLIFGSIGVALASSSAIDTLNGGAGDDFIVGGRGADTIDGGNGEDTVSFLSAPQGVTLDLDQGTGSAGFANGDSFASVENVLGSASGDKITGGNGRNILYGGAGSDRLVGGVGSDLLVGGRGGDKIYGDLLHQTDPGNSAATPIGRFGLTTDATLVGGLGGDAGYGENALDRNDDGSSSAIDITSVFGAAGLDFFGTNYTQLFVNNNGNLTFNAPLSAFTPGEITAGSGNPIIAAFWADVDTRNGAGVHDLVYYDLDTVNGVFTVTWDAVGFFSGHTSPTDSFQLQLINEGHGNFDIVLRYQEIGWTSGDASGGVAARAGYAAGNGVDYFELPESGDDAAMKGLPVTAGNTGIDGLFVFHVVNGQVFNDANDTIDGGAGADQLTGGPGADLFVFHAGQANGDTVTDFNDGSGDLLQFEGYGPDATLTQVDATHWQIGNDVITFSNAPTITTDDYVIG